MLRFRLPGPVPALLVAATLAAAAALPALAQQRPATPVQAQPAGAPTTSALSEVRARQAAERILRVLQSRDANARFAQFAPELQRVSSPSMIAETMKTQPQLLSWTITTIQPGYDSSGVEVILQTSAGHSIL